MSTITRSLSQLQCSSKRKVAFASALPVDDNATLPSTTPMTSADSSSNTTPNVVDSHPVGVRVWDVVSEEELASVPKYVHSSLSFSSFFRSLSSFVFLLFLFLSFVCYFFHSLCLSLHMFMCRYIKNRLSKERIHDLIDQLNKILLEKYRILKMPPNKVRC
jgi:hypothetical protein